MSIFEFEKSQNSASEGKAVELCFKFGNPNKGIHFYKVTSQELLHQESLKEVLISGLCAWCDLNGIGKGRSNLCTLFTEDKNLVIDRGVGDVWVTWTDDAWERLVTQTDMLRENAEILSSQEDLLNYKEQCLENSMKEEKKLCKLLRQTVADQRRSDEEHTEEMNKARAQILQLTENIERLTRCIENNNSEYGEVLKKLDENKSEQLRIKGEQMNIKVSKHEIELRQLQEENHKLKEEIFDLRNQLRTNKEEQNSIIEKQAEEMLALFREQHSELLDHLSKENIRLAQQLQSQDERMKLQEEQIKETTLINVQRMQSLEKQLKSKSDRLDAQASQLGKLRTENAGLDLKLCDQAKVFKTESDRLNRRLECQGMQLQQYKEDNAALISRIDMYRTDNNELTDRVEQFKVINSELTGRVELYHNENATLKARIESQAVQLEQYRTENASLSDRVNCLEDMMQEMRLILSSRNCIQCEHSEKYRHLQVPSFIESDQIQNGQYFDALLVSPLESCLSV